MAVGSSSKQNGDKSVAVNVRLQSTGDSSQPTLANYSHASVAQGVAYIDFGFLEPGLISAVTQRAQKGETMPKELVGNRTARVALPFDAVIRLHQQLQQMVASLQPAQSKLS
ncbi:MAG: hypothetical protein JSR62_03575 [Nitrospira sp.]|nr:hypothetical protein [Nitrospira sp.]